MISPDLVNAMAEDGRGSLGNNLFQIGAAVSHAQSVSCEVGIPKWAHSFMFWGLPGATHGWPAPDAHYHEPRYQYDPIPESIGAAGHAMIHGYFQSYKYLDPDVIRTVFRIDTALEDAARDYLSSLVSGGARDVVALHVRRGDYLGLQEYHPLVPLSFYEEALDRLSQRQRGRCVVITDDPEWCRCHFSGIPVTKSYYHLDFIAMTLVGGNIIANSSFSWWGAYLGDLRYSDRLVVAPGRWTGPAKPNHTMEDLIPPGWVIIPIGE